jgi:hypothetical protein
VGVFSAMLMSYPHLYPKISVAGRRFAGERGNVPKRGYDELGPVGEGDERRIKLLFQTLGPAECDSRMQNHTRWF